MVKLPVLKEIKCECMFLCGCYLLDAVLQTHMYAVLHQVFLCLNVLRKILS